ncbi:MAG TPA: enoyl-CoA hydratase, partial [Burkholderiales bacterium]
MGHRLEAPLLYERTAGIATLTLNRPQHYNALSAALLDDLDEQLAA